MAISKDRVRFNIPARYWDARFSEYVNLCQRAFGHTVRETYAHGITIVCRPSQFARFLIYRNNAIQSGKLPGCNTFAEFKPELFIPEVEPCEIDVSKNPRT